MRGVFAAIAAVSIDARLAPSRPAIKLRPELPPGWSVTHDGVGLYTIRHPILCEAEVERRCMLISAALEQSRINALNALEEIEIDVADHS